MASGIDFSPDVDFYRRHTVCSDPGPMLTWQASAPDDLPALRRLSTQLVFHYTAHGNPLEHGFTPDRLGEIDLRYADDQFARLAALLPGRPIDTDRATTELLLGCCRDFTLLLVSLLRSRGIAARLRVGHAGYFFADWWTDHVVAEVFGEADGAWRLVEAQLPADFAAVGGPLNMLDVPRDRFLTGDAAWIAARAGWLDPQRAAVFIDTKDPDLRGWPQLAHNLVLDLAALIGHEAVLWDAWGLLDSPDRYALSPATLGFLDEVAAAIAGGASLDTLRRLAADPLVAVPGAVTSYSPYDGSRRTVVLRRSPA